MERIYTKGTKILDSYGRERIFNGINVCDKGRANKETGKNDYDLAWDDTIAETLYTHGFNMIRMGITWDAVEPEPGKYNMAYLNKIRSYLDECEQKGIYVYLDMHQDLFSHYGENVGDGAPDWATDTGKYKPVPTRFVWAEGYFWRGFVHKAFDNFWENKKVDGKGLMDWFSDMWQFVVGELGSHPAVIGYDMFNEPFPGKSGGKVFRMLIKQLVVTTLTDDSISKLELIKRALSKEKATVLNLYNSKVFRKITSAGDAIIKDFDLNRYFPFISKISSSIREIDKDKILIMENSYYSNLGIPYSCPVPEVNGKPDGNVIFTPHAYDLMVDTPAYKYASNDRVGSIFAEHRRSQERLDVPVIVGEWGGFSEGNEWFPHVKFLLSLFDSYKWSNTYWAHFGGLFDTELFKDVLTRPYPRAVTGEIISYCHNRDEESFILTYKQDKAYSAPTEIFAHKPVKSIEADGEFTITPIKNSQGSVVTLKTNVGEHTIKITF